MNLFVFVDAHRPWREVKVTEQRTAVDFAECMRDLVDIHYPRADVIRVVMDNLSTHSPGALYEAFPAPEAHRILLCRALRFLYATTLKRPSVIENVISAGKHPDHALCNVRPARRLGPPQPVGLSADRFPGCEGHWGQLT